MFYHNYFLSFIICKFNVLICKCSLFNPYPNFEFPSFFIPDDIHMISEPGIHASGGVMHVFEIVQLQDASVNNIWFMKNVEKIITIAMNI